MDLLCRLLPFAVANGPQNMAADEVLLHSAAAGQASLRFYGWTEATLSLGYFQHSTRRLDDPLLRELPFVRRPTGGDALVHHHELTYCLAVPSASGASDGPGNRDRGHHWPRSPRYAAPWLRMHEIIAAALAEFGIDARLHAPSGGDVFAVFLCF